ncbi:MAG: type II secretion system F family protein [Chlamydiia bacterium]|nr:type II secretion system F family protein [Chlamydiia bacterium]
MPLFEYKSISPEGKKKQGLVNALSLDEAKNKLRLADVFILSLQARKRSFLGKWEKEEFTDQALITFTEQLAQLLKAGVPLYESLLSLEEQLREEKFHPILLYLAEQIKEGASLSHAMSFFPNSFNSLYQAMVAAGERIGDLENSLYKLSKILARQQKLKKQVLTTLLYPLLLGGFSLLVLALLMFFVVPSIEAVFEGRKVNHFTGCVINLSHFFTQFWPFLLSISLFLFISLAIYTRSCKGKHRLFRIAFSLPLIKTVLVQSALSRFCRTAASLLEGGVTLVEALSIGKKVMKNPLLEEIIDRATTRITEGHSLSSELKKSPLIPPMLVRCLAVGEESGNQTEMLLSVASLYEEEVERSLKKVTALAGPIILLIMGGIVGLIMLSVLLPLTDITAFVGD